MTRTPITPGIAGLLPRGAPAVALHPKLWKGRATVCAIRDGIAYVLDHELTSWQCAPDLLALDLSLPTLPTDADGGVIAATIIARAVGLDVSRGVLWQRSGARELRIWTPGHPQGGQQCGSPSPASHTRIFMAEPWPSAIRSSMRDCAHVVLSLAAIDPAEPEARNLLAAVLAEVCG